MSFHVTRFGRGAVSLLANGDAPLEVATIQRYVPAVFAETAHESRSGRFVPVPTHMLLGALGESGFRPFRVDLAGTGDAGKRGFTRHMLRLRHESGIAVRPEWGRIVPEVIITNANDGTGAYSIELGLFRFVCLNGMMAGNLYASTKVFHTGRPESVRDKVIEGTFEVIKDAPAMVAAAGELAALPMPRDAQLAFATDAARLRWPDGDAPIAPERLLAPRRQADMGATLWSTFNTLQENILQGGARYIGAHRSRRTVRPIRSIADDARINRALWSEALAWRSALAA